MTEQKIKPMSIGKIIDKALKNSVNVFKILLVPLIVATLVSIGAFYCQQSSEKISVTSGSIGLVSIIVNILVSSFVNYLVVISAVKYWRKENLTFKEVMSSSSANGYITFLLLGFTIGLVTFCGILLLVIPGLIYATNRILAIYSLVHENKGVNAALKNSKALMTTSSFFSLSGPYMRILGIGIVLLVIGAISSSLTIYGVINRSSVLGESVFFCILFITTVFNMLLKIIGHLCYAGLYFDLKSRHEGSDLMDEIEEINSVSAL